MRASIAIDGTVHDFVEAARVALLIEALGEEKTGELFCTARQSIGESAEGLRLAWRENDQKAAGRHAHRLAGVAANFGWPALAALASAIEKACRGGDDGKRYRDPLEEVLGHSSINAPPTRT